MTTTQDPQAVIGLTAIDDEGTKIGKVGQVYLDDQTGQPVWVTISTGLFGTRESFAPLHGSQADGDSLQLAVSKDMVKDAPSVDTDSHISGAESDELLSYYAGHLGDSSQAADGDYAPGQHADDTTTGREDLAGQPEVHGQGTPGNAADDAMTRSEEQLHVGTEQVETGRVRLRKHVVTEQVTQTVPVSHEEVRLEREPITDANRGQAMSGTDISEEEHQVTLHAERPVVQKEAVPVERVRLGTETVTEDHEINETVR
ncbi:MAG: PRC and DUF2382 domain-containing protein, partial [Actinomycetota bacterium]